MLAICIEAVRPPVEAVNAAAIGADLKLIGRDFGFEKSAEDRLQWRYWSKQGETMQRRSLAFPGLRGSAQLANASVSGVESEKPSRTKALSPWSPARSTAPGSCLGGVNVLIEPAAPSSASSSSPHEGERFVHSLEMSSDHQFLNQEKKFFFPSEEPKSGFSRWSTLTFKFVKTVW